MGTNDLAKETRAALVPGRAPMRPWLMTCVAAARAYGIDIVDGVYNTLDDEAGFAAECREGAEMGMDGKTLIHPKQVAPCNAAFTPDEADIAWAAASSPSSKSRKRIEGCDPGRGPHGRAASRRNGRPPRRHCRRHRLAQRVNIPLKRTRIHETLSLHHRTRRQRLLPPGQRRPQQGLAAPGSPQLSFDAVRGVTICGQAVVKEVEGVDYQPDMKLGDY